MSGPGPVVAAKPRYDVVLFGATGFTGALTAEYLVNSAPASTRWALAGRDRDGLDILRSRLAAINSAAAELPLLHADATDADSLQRLASSTRVLISTVGPYITHGEPLVAACSRAGTDYVDITAESEFVDTMYTRYHEQAVLSGARLVHGCGFDSIPHDLGAYFTVKQLPRGVPIRLDAIVRIGIEGGTRPGGTFSAGSLRSAVTVLSRPRPLMRARSKRRELEPPLVRRRVRTPRMAPRYERSLGTWLVPMPTIDRQVVCRSARALDRYGPDFGYRQYIALDRLSTAARAAGAGITVILLAQLGPARRSLLRRIKPDTGPTCAQRAGRSFTVRFVGEGGGQRVVTEVSGGDPGYGETAKMLAESALCLAYDGLPPSAGQLTTVAAMGDALTERLRSSGILFSSSPPESSSHEDV